MERHHRRDHQTEEEHLVPEDDRVIGRAFRRSLVILLGIAALVGAVTYLVRREPEVAPEISIDTVAPQTVQREAEAPSVVFRDISGAAGVDFIHFNGATGDKLLPETMGSGAAFFDWDNDLDADLLLVNSTAWPGGTLPDPRPISRLFRNDGTGRFEDISESVGLDFDLYATGVAVGDYNADGRTDVFLAAVGTNRLLRNVGNRFEDVTAVSGVGGAQDSWSTSAAFIDFDNDGDLDLFVANYVQWSREIDFEIDYRLTGVGRAYGPPTNYQGTFSCLYRNEGDGSFTDVSLEAGIQVVNPATGVPVGKALGVLPIDVDRDGWIDLFVANDTVQNFLFHNLGGTFEETGALWGLAYGRAGEATGAMGVDAGYYRNDDEVGFVIGNFANEMTSVYISQGDPTLFADEAIPEGVGAPSRLMLSFGLLLFDYDLDGRLDILQTNGHLEGEINSVDPSQTYEQPSQLFWNAGLDARQGFIPIAPETAGDLALPLVGRGSAVADIDGDGDQDVILTQAARRAVLLRNDQATGHHWLRVKLFGDAKNREALGARLELVAAGAIQRRQIIPARGYQSQSELVATFGLGATERIDSLTVFWPDGTVQPVEDPAVDRLIVVEKPTP